MRRNRFLAFLGFFLFACCVHAAEIEVRLELAYRSYVLGEPILVQVTLENQSRNTVRVRPESLDRLFFEITTSDLYDTLQPLKKGLMGGVFEMRPGERVQRKVELDKWFPLVREQKFLVRAVLLHRGMRYESQKKSFDVVPGLALQSGLQMFVNPSALKRSFHLVWWHRNQVDRIFLRTVDSPGERVWDTVDLGDLVRSQPPKLDIAPDGVVTVVHRASRDAFVRTVLWSLPDALEVVERNTLLDPEISTSQRAKSIYGEMAGDKKDEKKSWWKFW